MVDQDEKTIAELIHDSVFAAGGTLVVWFGGAKFKRIDAVHHARTDHFKCHDESGIDDAYTKFEPNSELLEIMKRNAAELRRYMEYFREEWCKECNVEIGNR